MGANLEKNTEFLGTLSINRDIKKICVNEVTGDYIELNAGDAGLIDRWRGFVTWFKQAGEQLQKEVYEKSDSNDPDTVLDMLHKRTEYLQECKNHIDMVFGAGAANKIFGDIIPDEMMIAEAMNGMVPFIEIITKQRLDRLTSTKYTPNKRPGMQSRRRKQK